MTTIEWTELSESLASALRDTPDHRLLFDVRAAKTWPLPNVWYGVSVEDRKHGVPRIDHLRRAPAAVRFLSIEPLLEDVGDLDLTGIHWVIAGAESGRKARPMEDNWVRRVRDQCIEQGVRFFFKQRVVGGKKVSLPILDGRTWEEMPARTTT